MIIATGSVNIDENTKLAEQAGEDNEEALKDLKSTVDGKITISTQAPFNDGVTHSNGDLWMIQSDGITTAMYTYESGGWSEKQWDQSTMNVRELSALSANLGTVNAGTINGVEINGSSITENSVNGTIKLDSSGFSAVSGSSYFKFMSSGSAQYTVIRGGLWGDDLTSTTANIGNMHLGGQTIGAYGNNTHIGEMGTWTYLAEGIKAGAGSYISPVSGTDIYFHNASGTTIDIHAGDVISHGSKLKSALSVKRDIQDYDSAEALAAVMNTEIKRWQYKVENNENGNQHIGPVIDDVNGVGSKTSHISHDMISTDSDGNYCLNESNTISILMAALQESNKRVNELSLRVAKLERGND